MMSEQEHEPVRSKSSRFAKIALFIVFMAMIFAAAGTLDWPELWFFLGFYVTTVTTLIIWLKKHDPGLLKERMSVGKNVKSWDKKIIRVYIVLLLIMFLIAPLDAVRFHWSHVPFVLKGIAYLIILVSWAIGLWAFRENSYLSQFVRIQADRGHQVCTTGPYKFIRHPMYLAVILTVLCLPLVLGSFWAFAPAALIAALFVLRTSLEDKTLRDELPGYAEYAEKVTWKLVPKVW
jgi:protein-S-isoprenylcysteine O-methyltransferase Ste14